ncbi:hypothetical protein ACWGKW_24755 [Streptomyces sp. NPDC054766]
MLCKPLAAEAQGERSGRVVQLMSITPTLTPLAGPEGAIDAGAELVADSLTGLVLGRPAAEPSGPHARQPVVARVGIAGLKTVQADAHSGLEVLSIGVCDGAPFSLAPVAGLPRLRTLTAYPGTPADPLEITELTGLEFLKLGPGEWRVLLDAGAVPRSLSAAAIVVHGSQDVLPIVDIANEILALRDRPQIIQTLLEGDLGPVAQPANGSHGPTRTGGSERPRAYGRRTGTITESVAHRAEAVRPRVSDPKGKRPQPLNGRLLDAKQLESARIYLGSPPVSQHPGGPACRNPIGRTNMISSSPAVSTTSSE